VVSQIAEEFYQLESYSTVGNALVPIFSTEHSLTNGRNPAFGYAYDPNLYPVTKCLK
jgi:hypothetical protein